MAGVLLSMLPLLALFVILRRQVINSLGGVLAR
jgi:ABC-type glycerol-3-phosphate transport system permease component